MRAIVRDQYGPPDVLKLEDVDVPVPGEGEVLVRVRAASINTADLDQVVNKCFEPLVLAVGSRSAPTDQPCIRSNSSRKAPAARAL